jgi:hypothetical protein
MWQWIKSNFCPSAGALFLAVAALSFAIVAIDQGYAAPNQKAAAESAQHESGPAEEPSAEEAIALYTLWLTGFTGVLALSTIGLIVATHNLGARTDRSMRTLERPYVRVVVTEHNIPKALASKGRADHQEPPYVKFVVANHGKTPADNIVGDAQLLAMGASGDQGEAKIALGKTAWGLGPGERSEELERRLVLAFDRSLCAEIEIGRVRFVFYGVVVYADIWGNQYNELWQAEYNLKEEILIVQRHEKLVKKAKQSA